MRKRWFVGLALVVAGIATPLIPFAAQVATVEEAGGVTDPAIPLTFTYTAAAGETNDLQVIPNPNESPLVYFFGEQGNVPVNPGPGCQQFFPPQTNAATCRGNFEVEIGLGNRDDRAQLTGAPGPDCAPFTAACVVTHGGTGDDRLDASV